MPLLQKAKDAGEDAKMLTVLSAGLESGPIDLDDLGLKKNFTLPNAARSMSTYNDLMVQVSLIHCRLFRYSSQASLVIRR